MHNKKGIIGYQIFDAHKNILAFSSTKFLFKEQTPRFTREIPKAFQGYRKQLSEYLKIPLEKFVFPRQTHTNRIASVQIAPKCEIKETDALVSSKEGICLCIQTADCVPVLLFDPVAGVIAAIHAGWRGTVNKIVENSVLKMVSEYQSEPVNILAAIGPSISQEVYEVGKEVVEAVKKSIPNSEKTLRLNANGKYSLNLWEANKQLLLRNGLRAKNIEILGECSFLKNEKYYSARRDGIETGRMVSGIMIKESAKNS